MSKELTASEITKQALQILKNKGYDVWRNNNLPVRGRAFIGRKGVPDIIGFDSCGRFVVCEVKKIGDTIKPAQREFLDQVSQAGCHAYLAVEEGGSVVLKTYPAISGEKIIQ